MRRSLPDIHNYTLPSIPGLIAGEYPGAWERADALTKLESFRDAGVTCFVDLTETGELAPYAQLLPQVYPPDRPVPVHHRFPIKDVSVPRSPEAMNALLDHLDDSIAAGHTVYLHCWGGVGRTGTVVGCYLVRQGLDGKAAIEEVRRLFGQTEKGRTGRVAPETPAQESFVLDWARHDAKSARAKPEDGGKGEG